MEEEKNKIVVLSKEDKKLINKIEVHIPKINKLVNFQKYLSKPKITPTTEFSFSFINNDITNRDKAVIAYFENQLFLIENINSIFVDEETEVFNNITKNSELKIEKIRNETNDFISKYINTKLSDFLLQVNNYVIEDDSKSEKVNKFIKNIEDPISRAELETFLDDFISFKNANKKRKQKNKKIIKLIYLSGGILFIILVSVLMLVFFL